MTTPSISMPIREGEVLAEKYRVERFLGVGGMGVVVAATHLQLGKRVALKWLLPDALTMPAAVERFEREARAAVHLRGEHVAQVLDVGHFANGAPYLVMELLEGRDLGALAQEKGQLPLEDVVDFVLQACEAVAEAHAAGIVHRDLKPRNLFLTTRINGTPLVKVLDFGISKWETGSDISLTRTHEVIGSPAYMSPEQIKNARDVDGRADIWSLGIILYELIAGRLPFLGESVPHLYAVVLAEPPAPLATLRPGVPAALGDVVLKCLEKNPAARFRTVHDLASALEPFAPPRSRSALENIGAITSPHAATVHAGPTPRVHVSHGTSISWADTLLASPRGKRAASAIVIAVIAAAVVVLLAFGSRVSPPRDSAVIAQSAATAPASDATRADPTAPATTFARIDPADAAPPATTASTAVPASAHATARRAPRTPATAAAITAATTAAAGATSSATPREPASRPEDVLMPGDRK
jgi:eukaryotic-like serine/threonine-protein kinase